MDTHFVYHVNKGLSIISREMSDHLDLIAVREDGRYQGGALVRGKGIADQPVPGGEVAIRKNRVKLTVG